jgi:hypothetical protein
MCVLLVYTVKSNPPYIYIYIYMYLLFQLFGSGLSTSYFVFWRNGPSRSLWSYSLTKRIQTVNCQYTTLPSHCRTALHMHT